MIKFKCCPRCARGDLMLERDGYGWFMRCVQCAYIIAMVAATAKEEPTKQRFSILRTAA